MESQTGIVNLPKHDPEPFEMFELWLYTSALGMNIKGRCPDDDEESGAVLDLLARAVILADSLGASRLPQCLH